MLFTISHYKNNNIKLKLGFFKYNMSNISQNWLQVLSGHEITTIRNSTPRFCTSYVPNTRHNSTFLLLHTRDRCHNIQAACTIRTSQDTEASRAGTAFSASTSFSRLRAKDVQRVNRRCQTRTMEIRRNASYAPMRSRFFHLDNNNIDDGPSCTSTCRTLHKLSSG